MKREFGKMLIEECIPRWDLTHVTDIIFIEKHWGTHCRQDALVTAHARLVLRQQVLKDLSFKGANSYGDQDEDRD